MSFNKFNRQHQRGFSFLKALFIGTILVGGSAIGMKFFPTFYEYQTMKRAIKATAALNQKSPAEIRTSLSKFMEVNDIRGLTDKDFGVTPNKSGSYDITFDYQREVPINTWMRVVMDFKGSSADEQ